MAARTAGLLAVTSAVGWLLTTDLVSGPLTIPLTSLDELRRWLDDSTPAIVPAAILRLVALAMCAYLALALVLALVAQVLDRRPGGRALHAVGRLLPATLRGMLTGGAQFSLVAASALPLGALPVAAAHGDPPGSTATMAKLDPIEAAGELPPPPAASPTATMTRLPAAVAPATKPDPTTTVTLIAPTTAPTSLAPVPLPPRSSAPATSVGSADDTWTVTPGDTFWSIAEETLADHRGSFPPQDEIVRYWRQLIATNQPRLAAPGNPDLLLPGQSLLLPPPS
jgi:nucleoid-associated protein YgaU